MDLTAQCTTLTASMLSNDHKQNAIGRLRLNYAAIKANRQLKAIKIIHHSEGSVYSGSSTIKSKAIVKCRATTMSGKKCPFRASCGEYCKKHDPR